MREQSSTSWQRRGSSVVFDREALGPLIGGGAWMVSLREALGWREKLPAPPPSSSTILITGLEAVLESLPPAAAEEFLEQRLTPLIRKIEGTWNHCGVVFGFAAGESSFQVTGMAEEVVFRVGGGATVRLSQPLWDGSATLNLTRLYATRDGQNLTVGYYVLHIS